MSLQTFQATRENEMQVAIQTFGDKRLDDTFNRIFGGSFHSEATRQELIGKKARSIEAEIVANVLRDIDDAMEVGSNLIGFLDESDEIKIARFIASGDREGLFQLMLKEYGESLKRTAECRAIKLVEAGGLE
jgi:hypothetical protein